MKDIRRVAIAGAGTMGYSLAQAFSAAGYPVKLYDLFPAALDKARDMIALNQQTEVTSGKLTAEQSAALIGRISLTSQLEDLANTDFLVEAILEKLEVKHDFYRQLCAVVAEDAILCSNTSGLSITKIAEAVTHPERFAGMHWMNPPHIIPLIEIVEGEKTAPETAECVRQVALGMKKKPVIVKLSPNVTDIVSIAKACEDAGADGISLINTMLGMRIDLRTRKPVIANKMGGFSGPAIFPVALRMVYQVAGAVKIPVVGMGGVSSAEDVVEMMLAGATAVEVGAANLVNPYACRDIIRELPAVMEKYKIENLKDIIGGAK